MAVDQPSFDPDQASRFLLTAERTGLSVQVLLTKCDLIDPQQREDYRARLQGWGYDPLLMSSRTGEGISALKQRLLSSSLSVLCGPSGVGKTSLLKAISGTHPRSGGGLEVDGEQIGKLPAHALARRAVRPVSHTHSEPQTRISAARPRTGVKRAPGPAGARRAKGCSQQFNKTSSYFAACNKCAPAASAPRAGYK